MNKNNKFIEKNRKKLLNRAILRSFFLILIVIHIGILCVNFVSAFDENILLNVNMTNYTLPIPYQVNTSCAYLGSGFMAMDNNTDTYWDRFTCSENPVNLTYYFGGRNVTIDKFIISGGALTGWIDNGLNNFTLYGRNVSGTWKELYTGYYDNTTASNTFEFYNDGKETYQEILLNLTSLRGSGRLFLSDIDFYNRNVSYDLNYNSSSYESNSELFTVNVSYNTTLYQLSSAILYYNNTYNENILLILLL